jgi:hypothetical protein
MDLFLATKRNLLKFFLSIAFVVLAFSFFYETTSAQDCWCNWSWCYTADSEGMACYPYKDYNPDHWYGEEYYSAGDCGGSTCKYYYGTWDDFEIREGACSTACHPTLAYGDKDLGYSSWNTCVQSCGGEIPPGNGGDTCDYGNINPYSCSDSGNEGLLRLQFWHADYFGGWGYWGQPRGLSYSDITRYAGADGFNRLRPDGFCPYWYWVTWTGYINIPAGQREFDILTNFDSDPDAFDRVTGRTGVYLGYWNQGGVLVPYGTIDPNSGAPTNLTEIIPANPANHSFSGNFSGGWYPVYAYYLVGESDEPGFINLRWRTPGGSFTRVPANEDTYRPCSPLTTNNPPTACVVSASVPTVVTPGYYHYPPG